MKLDRAGVTIRKVAVLGLALALAACGSDNEPSSSPAGTGAADVDCGGKPSLTASGSTAQANAMARFIAAYERACPGQKLVYNANGSGAGIRDFIDEQTDFGGSDSPLSGDESAEASQRCGSEAWHLPVVFGPLAVTYNIKDVDTLVLDAPTIANIFNGTITRWDDPAITALNPSMPPGDIHVVYRGDESGTTDNFQQYLEAASDGAWGKGVGKTFEGGVGEPEAGNEGTAAKVNDTEGAISYNEWSFAQRQNLPAANILTPAGPDPVAISIESTSKTIANARVAVQGNDLVLDTSSFYLPTERGAYPIVLATYEIVCSKYPDPEVGRAVRAFLQSTIGPGQHDLGNHGYVPLPADFSAKVSTAVDAIA